MSFYRKCKHMCWHVLGGLFVLALCMPQGAEALQGPHGLVEHFDMQGQCIMCHFVHSEEGQKGGERLWDHYPESEPTVGETTVEGLCKTCHNPTAGIARDINLVHRPGHLYKSGPGDVLGANPSKDVIQDVDSAAAAKSNSRYFVTKDQEQILSYYGKIPEDETKDYIPQFMQYDSESESVVAQRGGSKVACYNCHEIHAEVCYTSSAASDRGMDAGIMRDYNLDARENSSVEMQNLMKAVRAEITQGAGARTMTSYYTAWGWGEVWDAMQGEENAIIDGFAVEMGVAKDEVIEALYNNLFAGNYFICEVEVANGGRISMVGTVTGQAGCESLYARDILKKTKEFTQTITGHQTDKGTWDAFVGGFADEKPSAVYALARGMQDLCFNCHRPLSADAAASLSGSGRITGYGAGGVDHASVATGESLAYCDFGVAGVFAEVDGRRVIYPTIEDLVQSYNKDLNSILAKDDMRFLNNGGFYPNLDDGTAGANTINVTVPVTIFGHYYTKGNTEACSSCHSLYSVLPPSGGSLCSQCHELPPSQGAHYTHVIKENINCMVCHSGEYNPNDIDDISYKHNASNARILGYRELELGEPGYLSPAETAIPVMAAITTMASIDAAIKSDNVSVTFSSDKHYPAGSGVGKIYFGHPERWFGVSAFGADGKVETTAGYSDYMKDSKYNKRGEDLTITASCDVGCHNPVVGEPTEKAMDTGYWNTFGPGASYTDPEDEDLVNLTERVRYNRAYWWPWLSNFAEYMSITDESATAVLMDRGFYLSIQCVNCHDYQGYLLESKSSKHPFKGLGYEEWFTALRDMTNEYNEKELSEKATVLEAAIGDGGILYKIGLSRRYCTACHVRHRYDTRVPRMLDPENSTHLVGGTGHTTGRIKMNDPDPVDSVNTVIWDSYDGTEIEYSYATDWERPDGYTSDDYGDAYGYEYSPSYNDYGTIYTIGNRVRPWQPVIRYFDLNELRNPGYDIRGDQLFCLNCHDDSATYSQDDYEGLVFSKYESGDSGAGGPNILPYNPYESTSYLNPDFYHNRIPKVNIKDFYTRVGHGRQDTASGEPLELRCAGIETCHNPHGSDAKGLLREYGMDIDLVRVDNADIGQDGVYVDVHMDETYGTVRPYITDDRWKRSREYNPSLNNESDPENFVYTVLNKEYWLDPTLGKFNEDQSRGVGSDIDIYLNEKSLPFEYLNRFCYRCHTDATDNRYYPGNTSAGSAADELLVPNWMTFDSSAHGPYRNLEDSALDYGEKHSANSNQTNFNFNNVFDYDSSKPWTSGLSAVRFRHKRRFAGMCVNCHNPHGDGIADEEDPQGYVVFKNMTNYNGEQLCFRCHTNRPTTEDGDQTVIGFPSGAAVDVLFDSSSAGDGRANGPDYPETTSYHDVYDHAQSGYNDDPDTSSKIECVNCHNVHIARRNYEIVDGKRVPFDSSTNFALIDPDPNWGNEGIENLDSTFNYPFIAKDSDTYKGTITEFCLRCHDHDPGITFPLTSYEDLDPPSDLLAEAVPDKFRGELPNAVEFPRAYNRRDENGAQLNKFRLWNKKFFYYDNGHMNDEIKKNNVNNEFINGVSCIDCHNPHGSGIEALLYESTFITVDSTWVKATDNGVTFCYECHKFPIDNGFYNGQRGWYSANPIEIGVRYFETLNGYDSSIHGYAGVDEGRLKSRDGVTNYTDYDGEGGYGHYYDTTDAGKCVNCHNPHGTENPNMTLGGVGEDLCFKCHDATATDVWSVKGRNIEHEFFGPTGNRVANGSLHNIDTISQNNDGMKIECISCHNPHVVSGKFQDQVEDSVSPLTDPEWPVRFVKDTMEVDIGVAADITIGMNITTYCLKCHDADGQNNTFDGSLRAFVENDTYWSAPDFGIDDDAGNANTRRYTEYPDTRARYLDENKVEQYESTFPTRYTFSMEYSTTKVVFPSTEGKGFSYDKEAYYRYNGHGAALTTSISDPIRMSMMVECAGGECHLPHGSSNAKLITDATVDVDNDGVSGVPQYRHRYVTLEGAFINPTWAEVGAYLGFDLSPINMSYLADDAGNKFNDTRDNFCNVACHRPDMQHAFTYDRDDNGNYQGYGDDVYNSTMITYRLRDASDESDGTEIVETHRRDPAKRFGHPSDTYMPGFYSLDNSGVMEQPEHILATGELNTSEDESSFVDAQTGFKLYNGKLICLTCHDPHGTTTTLVGSGTEYSPDLIGEWKPAKYRDITNRWIDKDPRDSSEKEGMTRLEPDNAKLCRQCHNLVRSLDKLFLEE